jgi:hypothetical protein
MKDTRFDVFVLYYYDVIDNALSITTDVEVKETKKQPVGCYCLHEHTYSSIDREKAKLSEGGTT